MSRSSRVVIASSRARHSPRRLVKHARYYWLLLAEGHLNRKLFGQMLGRLAALPVPGG